MCLQSSELSLLPRSAASSEKLALRAWRQLFTAAFKLESHEIWSQNPYIP